MDREHNEKNISDREIKPEALGVPELAEMYNVSKYVFLKWLKPFKKEIGPRKGHKYTPKQVRKIFEALDPP